MHCKCCDSPAEPAFQLDFNRSCEDRHTPIFPPSGEAVSYYRCQRCDFVFTTHFDNLSSAEMAAKIYNDDYVRVDPDFQAIRPRYWAELLAQVRPSARAAMSVLDFGGGKGELTGLVRDLGFKRAASYDPFFGDNAIPEGRYDLITAFEVFEHTVDPIGTAEAAASLLAPGGVLLFSTLLQPRGELADWWYIAPRNGHISIHTRKSLALIAARLHLRYMPISNGLHIFHSGDEINLAAVAAPLLAQQRYDASLEGPTAYLRIALPLARLGQIRAAFDPRHVARALLAMFGQGAQRR